MAPTIIVSSTVISVTPLRSRLPASMLASIGVIFARCSASAPLTGIV